MGLCSFLFWDHFSFLPLSLAGRFFFWGERFIVQSQTSIPPFAQFRCLLFPPQQQLGKGGRSTDDLLPFIFIWTFGRSVPSLSQVFFVSPLSRIGRGIRAFGITNIFLDQHSNPRGEGRRTGIYRQSNKRHGHQKILQCIVDRTQHRGEGGKGHTKVRHKHGWPPRLAKTILYGQATHETRAACCHRSLRDRLTAAKSVSVCACVCVWL